MNIDDIFAAAREHGSEIRVHNLRLQMRGFDQLPVALKAAIREQRYELVRQLGMDGCPLATDVDVRDLQHWLDDGTLAWAGRRGVIIVPGWEYNEAALLVTARNYLHWYATGSGGNNDAFLQWTRLIVERVRVMLGDNEGRNE